MKEFLIILKNMLEHHADLRFIWNYESKEYELKGLNMDIGAWHISVSVDWPLTVIHMWEDIDDRSWLMVDLKDINIIINGLKGSYFDFLLEGIE